MWLFLLLLIQAPQGAPVQGAEQPKATLRGHVYALDNGAPVKRALVTLRNTRGPNDSQSVLTGAQGAFELRNLEPGSYVLSCSKAGFVSTSYGLTEFRRSTSLIRLQPGQELGDADMKMARTGAISGIVTEADGEPLSNVTVNALVRTYQRGKPDVAIRGSATSDDHGRYRIFNLTPGRYYVQASSSRAMFSYTTEEAISYAPAFYPNVSSIQEAQRVEVGNGGDVSRIDVTLQTVTTYSLSGKVMDGSSGNAMTGGFISATSANVIRMGGGGAQIRPDGSFKITSIPTGRVRLSINARDSTANVTRSFVHSVDVGASDISGLIVTLYPPVSVRGKLIAEGGTLPERLRVSLPSRTAGFSGNGAAVAKDSTFEVQNLQAGDYDVEVFRDGGPVSGSSGFFYIREVRRGRENILERGLTVSPNTPVADLEVILDFQTGTLAGRATGDDAAPLAGTLVVLLSADPAKRGSNRYFRLGGTGANGTIRIPGIIPGDYLALLWPGRDGYQLLDPDIFGPLEKHATRVTIERGATAQLELRLVPEIRTAAKNAAQ